MMNMEQRTNRRSSKIWPHHNADLCSDAQCLLPECINRKMKNRLSCVQVNSSISHKGRSSHAISTTKSGCHTTPVTHAVRDSCHISNGARAATGISSERRLLQLNTKRKASREDILKRVRKSSEEHSLSVAATESQSDLAPVNHTSFQKIEVQRSGYTKGTSATSVKNTSYVPKAGVLSGQKSAVNHVPQSDVPEAVMSNTASWISPLDSHPDAQSTAQAKLPISLPLPFDEFLTVSEQDLENIDRFLETDLLSMCKNGNAAIPLPANPSFPVSERKVSEDTSCISWKCNTPLTMQMAHQCDAVLECRNAPLQISSAGSTTAIVPTTNANPGPFTAQIAYTSDNTLTESNQGDNKAEPGFTAVIYPTATQIGTHPKPLSCARSASPLPKHGSITGNSAQDISSPFSDAVLNCLSKVFRIFDQPRSYELENLFTSILEETVLKLESAILVSQITKQQKRLPALISVGKSVE